MTIKEVPQIVIETMQRHYPDKDNLALRRGLVEAIKPYLFLGGKVSFIGVYQYDDIRIAVPIITNASGALDFQLADFWQQIAARLYTNSIIFKQRLKSDDANDSLKQLVKIVTAGGAFKGLKLMTLLPSIMKMRDKLHLNVACMPYQLFDLEGKEVIDNDFDLAPSVLFTFNALDVQALLADSDMVSSLSGFIESSESSTSPKVIDVL